jgi:hypothetical protein
MLPSPKCMILLAGYRVGGTLLSHALSNHTQIFFVRGEPFRGHPLLSLHRSKLDLLRVLLTMPGYHVSGCKLLYNEALDSDFHTYLLKTQPNILWLRRRNILRQALSLITMSGKSPQASFDPIRPEPVRVRIEILLATMCRMQEESAKMTRHVKMFRKVLPLYYEDLCPIVDRQLPEAVTEKICNFLGVRVEPLYCDLQRIHSQPLSQYINNWIEVKSAIQSSEFVQYLEGEI